jgi:hypothetical protein
MGTHRISKEVESRMFEYLRARRKGPDRWDYTFDEAVGELLTEAGF